MTNANKQCAFDWIDQNRQNLSDWNQIIWHLAEPAWREYKSSAWYVKKLREEGFEVEKLEKIFILNFRHFKHFRSL